MLTEQEWYDTEDPYDLVDALYYDKQYPFACTDTDARACVTPGCCGNPMLTCDEIRAWYTPSRFAD